MNFFCKKGETYHAQAVYSTPSSEGYCSSCGMFTRTSDFWDWHERGPTPAGHWGPSDTRRPLACPTGGPLRLLEAEASEDVAEPSRTVLEGTMAHMAAQLDLGERQHNSMAAQLRDARELLNQVNQELAELGDENNRLRAEVSRLKSKQFRSLP